MSRADQLRLQAFEYAMTSLKDGMEDWVVDMAAGDPLLVNHLVLVNAACSAAQAGQVLLREALHTWPDA